jgi:hypothetical protein
MIFCSFCGRQHDSTACPPQTHYQSNPLHEYLAPVDLLSVIRSQANYIISLEEKLRGEKLETRIIEVPIETNTEKVTLFKDLLTFILKEEIRPESHEEWVHATHEATKIVANLQTTIEFIKSATNRNV